MGANAKVHQFGIGLREEEMGHQMKNIGRSKEGMLYDSVLSIAQPHGQNGVVERLR
jgi:hypothetical protein